MVVGGGFFCFAKQNRVERGLSLCDSLFTIAGVWGSAPTSKNGTFLAFESTNALLAIYSAIPQESILT
jgi:hypothetical protein